MSREGESERESTTGSAEWREEQEARERGRKDCHPTLARRRGQL